MVAEHFSSIFVPWVQFPLRKKKGSVITTFLGAERKPGLPAWLPLSTRYHQQPAGTGTASLTSVCVSDWSQSTSASRGLMRA